MVIACMKSKRITTFRHYLNNERCLWAQLYRAKRIACTVFQYVYMNGNGLDEWKHCHLNATKYPRVQFWIYPLHLLWFVISIGSLYRNDFCASNARDLATNDIARYLMFRIVFAFLFICIDIIPSSFSKNWWKTWRCNQHMKVFAA